jgi:hypothetical protein
VGAAWSCWRLSGGLARLSAAERRPRAAGVWSGGLEEAARGGEAAWGQSGGLERGSGSMVKTLNVSATLGLVKLGWAAVKRPKRGVSRYTTFKRQNVAFKRR